MRPPKDRDTSLRLIVEACMRELDQYCDHERVIRYAAMAAGMEPEEFRAELA
jgi:hypothetical protein